MTIRSVSLLSIVLGLVLSITGNLSFQAQSARQPIVIQAAAPVYPFLATFARVSGTVVVEVRIGEKGDVTAVRTIEGHELLRQAAENAARQWVFTPLENQADLRTGRLVFTFKLLPSDTPPAELMAVFKLPDTVEIKGTVPQVIVSPNIDPPTRYYPPRRSKAKKKQ